MNDVYMDLNPDTQIQLSLQSTFLNDEGSFSIGITVPATKKNLAALGFPNRIDHAERPKVEVPCTIKHGIIELHANAIIQRVSEDIEFDCLLLEGELYDKMRTVMLRDICTKMLHFPAVDLNNDVYTELTKCSREDNGEYTIFEICTAFEEKDGITTLKIKNRVLDDGTYGTMADHPLSDGYAPFLYLHYVIEQIFAHFNITFNNNPFKTGALRKIVLLNNLIDGVASFRIDYKCLVPDCTALELIRCIENKFGCRFLLDYNKRQVNCIFIKDIFAGKNYIDWSTKLLDKMYPQYSEAQKLTLSSATSLDKAAPTSTNLKTWYSGAADEVYTYTDITFGDSKVYLIREQGCFGRNMYAPGIHGVLEIKGSVNYEFISPGEESEFSISTDDEMIGPIHSGESNSFNFISYPFFPASEKRKDKVFNQETNETTEPNDTKCPIAFSFYYGVVNNGLLKKAPFGSPWGAYSELKDMNFVSRDIGLSLDWVSSKGLYNTFYKEYDDFLKHANIEYTASFKLTQSDIYSIDWSKKIMINNQIFFLKSLDVTLDSSGVTVDSATLCSCRSFVSRE